MSKFAYSAFLFLLLPLTANAYHQNLIKGRIGYFNIKSSIGTAHNGITPQQKVTPGGIAEIAVSRFLSSYTAVEVGAGCAFINTKGPSDTKRKDSILIPLTGIAQIHLPMGNMFKPYAGLGYEFQIAEQTKGLKINKAGDLVYQAGIDLFMFDQVGLNLDMKYSRVKHKLKANGISIKSRFKTLTTMIGVAIPF